MAFISHEQRNFIPLCGWQTLLPHASVVGHLLFFFFCEETPWPQKLLRWKHFIGADSQFRGLDHYHHCGKYEDMKADMVLEKQLKVPHLDQQAAGKERDIWSLKAQPWWCTSCNKTTPTPTRPHLLIVQLPKGLWRPFSFKPLQVY